jgi:hypothetical protein
MRFGELSGENHPDRHSERSPDDEAARISEAAISSLTRYEWDSQPRSLMSKTLQHFEKREAMYRWMTTPNQSLGGRTPVQALKDGNFQRYENVLSSAPRK